MKEFVVVLDTKVNSYKEVIMNASFFNIRDGFMYFYLNDQTQVVGCFNLSNVVYVNQLS